MADVTKVTYSLNICFFLRIFKANNGDFHLIFMNISVSNIIRYTLWFLHNSMKCETN